MKKLIILLLVLAGMVSTASAWNYLKGTFNSWTASADYCTDNGPVAVYLTADETPYEFKIDAGTWYGATSANQNITGTTTTSSFTTSGTDNNFKLTVSTTGYYVFSVSWNNDWPTLTVRYPNTTVYFYNTLGWTDVYMHDGWWGENDADGASNKNALRGVKMTAGANNIYTAYIPKESLYRVTFTSDKQVNDGDGQYGAGYDHFYGTNVVWNADAFDENKPFYAPINTVSETKNSCDYYYGGTWHAYSTYTRSVTAGNFGTICLPFAATVTGATVFKIKNKVMSGEALAGLNLESVDALEAGKAYIFKATETTLTATLSGNFTSAVEANGMMGNLGSTIQAPIGSYVIGNNEIHEVTGDAVNVGQYKGYITLEGIPAGARSANFIAFEDGGATAIDVISKMEDVRGDVYNLNGQRVAQPTKGLYVVNGKKVIIK